MDAKRQVSLLDPTTYPEVDTLLDHGGLDRASDFYLDINLVGPQDSGGSAGGHLCNTAPTTLQKEPDEPLTKPQEVGGYDTLEILVYGQWEQERFAHLTEELDRVKQEAAEAEHGSEGGLLEIAGDEVMVCPSGVKRGLYCSWRFTWQGMDFALVNRCESDEQCYGIHLTIGSIACMEAGGEACWNDAKDFLAKLGFHVMGNKISRTDVCVDLMDVNTHDMVMDYLQFKFITRGRKFAIHGENHRLETFYRGSGKRIMLRVYDKLRELRESTQDLVKHKILLEKRWGGEIPKHATRVEFQLRREALKDFGVDSVEDLFEKAGEISVWLTHKWFRMTEEVPDRNHTDRAETSRLWVKVQDYFAKTFGDFDPNEVQRHTRRVFTVDPEPLKRQITGCLTSVAACMGRLVRTPTELATFAMEVVFEGGLELVQEVLDKRAGMETWLHGIRAERPESINRSGGPCPILAQFART